MTEDTSILFGLLWTGIITWSGSHYGSWFVFLQCSFFPASIRTFFWQWYQPNYLIFLYKFWFSFWLFVSLFLQFVVVSFSTPCLRWRHASFRAAKMANFEKNQLKIRKSLNKNCEKLGESIKIPSVNPNSAWKSAYIV